MDALAQVLESPLTIHVSQQVADDPALRLFDLLIVLGECPLPDAPENSAENTASVAVSEARRVDDGAVVLCSFVIGRPEPATERRFKTSHFES